MIISIDAEKVSDQILYRLLIKAISKAGTENLIKGINKKSIANIIINDERQCFPLKIRMNIVTECLSQYNRTRKRIKHIPIKKEEVKHLFQVVCLCI